MVRNTKKAIETTWICRKIMACDFNELLQNENFILQNRYDG